jgi:hypothetical protein
MLREGMGDCEIGEQVKCVGSRVVRFWVGGKWGILSVFNIYGDILKRYTQHIPSYNAPLPNVKIDGNQPYIRIYSNKQKYNHILMKKKKKTPGMYIYLPLPPAPHASTPKPHHLKPAPPRIPSHAPNLLLLIQHLGHTPTAMHDDARFGQTGLDGLAALEDVADFFEGAAPRLDEEEVDEDEFEYVPEDEEEVVLYFILR